LIIKAYDLIKKRRVERVGDGLYNVVGDHGTYTVGKAFKGKVSCSCPGFVRKGRCSHSLAVIMLNDSFLFKSIEGTIKKNRSAY
jgi:hypothetical protein